MLFLPITEIKSPCPFVETRQIAPLALQPGFASHANLRLIHKQLMANGLACDGQVSA
jgi:hypothetical protein